MPSIRPAPLRSRGTRPELGTPHRGWAGSGLASCSPAGLCRLMERRTVCWYAYGSATPRSRQGSERCDSHRDLHGRPPHCERSPPTWHHGAAARSCSRTSSPGACGRRPNAPTRARSSARRRGQTWPSDQHLRASRRRPRRRPRPPGTAGSRADWRGRAPRRRVSPLPPRRPPQPSSLSARSQWSRPSLATAEGLFAVVEHRTLRRSPACSQSAVARQEGHPGSQAAAHPRPRHENPVAIKIELCREVAHAE